MSAADQVEARLREALAPAHLEILDDSRKHAGHAGAAGGGGHFSLVIVSESFRGRSTLERHRGVYTALGDLLKHEVHALALQTFDPDEWARKRSGVLPG